EHFGAVIPGSASAVKVAEASCPDADSECRIEKPATIGVEAVGWLGLESLAKLDLFFFEWPVGDPVSPFEEETPLAASILDRGWCIEIGICFLRPDLALGYLP
ncbi:hypothetical protein Tco_1488851, partial [Tanacetum coccineum]